jgi:hypothetical protein
MSSPFTLSLGAMIDALWFVEPALPAGGDPFVLPRLSAMSADT